MRKELAKKVGVWALAVALLAAHFFFRSVAHADVQPAWQPFFAQGGECKISFPVQPQLIQQSLPLSQQGHRLNYDVYVAPMEDKGVCLLLIATYPMALPGGHEISGLEGLIQGIVNHNPDNKLIFADIKDFAGHPSIDFLVQSGTSYFRGHALMVGNKLFLIAMEGKTATRDEKTYARFLKSFHLVD